MSGTMAEQAEALVYAYMQDRPRAEGFNDADMATIRLAILEYIMMGSTFVDPDVNAWMGDQSAPRIDLPEVGPESIGETLDENYSRIGTILGVSNATLAASIAKSSEDPWSLLLGKDAVPLSDGDAPGKHPLIDKLVDMKLLDSESADWVREIFNESRALGGLLTTAIIAGIALKAVGNIGDIAGGDFYRNALKRLTPSTPTVGELLKPSRVAPELGDQITELMRENGYTPDDIDLLKLNNYRLFEEIQIRELYLREIIDETRADDFLRQLGYTDERIAELKQVWSIIPSPQDILWMVGKEAFEEDQVQMFGLDAEMPTEQMEWLRKQGVSDYWSVRYWRAHWSQISTLQGFEMLHRGVINDEQLDGLFRVQEIPPFWRDKLRAISYHPYTRVDVRRMYRDGAIGLDEVYKTYRDLGYDHEHAANLTTWTERQYQDEPKQLTRSQIESGYRDGILQQKESVELLQGLGYSESQAQFLIEYVDFKQLDKLKDKQVAVIQKRFTNHLITESDVTAALTQLEVSAARASILVDEWKLDILLDVKLPSKTDVDKMLKAGVIGEGVWRNYMVQLGYDDTVIELYWKLHGMVAAPADVQRGL